uniref:Rab-GAP TBC domain-containing protein n=1 Tax=Canis lupus familiaris TaxID=9615 RepID=A0A8C0P3I1_CANLF
MTDVPCSPHGGSDLEPRDALGWAGPGSPRRVQPRDTWEGLRAATLFLVLAAYSVYDTEVGYCQGMREITAILLMFLPEEDAFWALAQLMVDDRHAMHGRGPPGCRAGGESGGPPCRLLHGGGGGGAGGDPRGGAGGDPPARPPTGKGPASPVASGSRSHGHPPHRLQARLALPLLPQPPAQLPACPPGSPGSLTARPHGAQGAVSQPPASPQPHSQAPQRAVHAHHHPRGLQPLPLGAGDPPVPAAAPAGERVLGQLGLVLSPQPTPRGVSVGRGSPGPASLT